MRNNMALVWCLQQHAASDLISIIILQILMDVGGSIILAQFVFVSKYIRSDIIIYKLTWTLIILFSLGKNMLSVRSDNSYQKPRRVKPATWSILLHISQLSQSWENSPRLSPQGSYLYINQWREPPSFAPCLLCGVFYVKVHMVMRVLGQVTCGFKCIYCHCMVAKGQVLKRYPHLIYSSLSSQIKKIILVVKCSYFAQHALCNMALSSRLFLWFPHERLTKLPLSDN